MADPAESTSSQHVVNDFSISVATVNGSGSQTANQVLLRAIFQMGVPISGKNMFPSNIAGLPTWYTIRANAKGYIARKKEIDFLVAMNAETAREDVMSLDPGRAVVYDAPLKLNELRQDLVFYPVPFDKIVAEVCPDAKLRRLVKNMITTASCRSCLGRAGRDEKAPPGSGLAEGDGAQHGRARGGRNAQENFPDIQHPYRICA
jgi:2-oxoglutarate ferredoxin oxidoreductase subunit alpha